MIRKIEAKITDAYFNDPVFKRRKSCQIVDFKSILCWNIR